MLIDPIISRACALAPRKVLGLICLFFFMGLQGAHAQQAATNFTAFTTTVYTANENDGFATVDLIRTGDLTGFSQVTYLTTDGTARSGIDYGAVRGTLFFFPFDIVRSFSIPLFDNFVTDGPRTVILSLSDPIATGLVAPTNAVLNIIDDDSVSSTNLAGQVTWAGGWSYGFFFGGGISGSSSSGFSVMQTEWTTDGKWDNTQQGAELTIVRRGGSKGRILVDFATTNITAVPGVSYLATNGTVALNDFQMSTNIVIRLPQISFGRLFRTNDTQTNIFDIFPPPGIFRVVLSNVRPDPQEDPAVVQPTLGSPIATVSVADNTAGFAFERLHYEFRETRGRTPGQTSNIPVLRIPVLRSFNFGEAVSVRYIVNALDTLDTGTGGDHRWNTFLLEAGSDYAAPFADFDPPGNAVWQASTGRNTEGILNWSATNPDPIDLLIPIINDSEVEFNEDLRVELFKLNGESDGVVNPYSTFCNVKILFDDQPAGALDRNWNPDNNNLTDPPNNRTPGANQTVQAVAVQPDGKLVIGGDFTSVNTRTRNRIARFLANGQVDTSFNPGSGADNYVSSITLQPDGKILIGGGFTSINGTQRYHIARLNADGSLDATFNPGLGANGQISSMAVMPDGRIYIAGDFTSYDGTSIAYFARLLSTGRLDSSFKPGKGPDGPVNSVAISSGTIEFDRESSKGQSEDRYTTETGGTAGVATVDFTSFQNANSIRLYYEGNLLYDSGPVSSNLTFSVNYGPGASTTLEFVVDENRNGSGESWFYHAVMTPVTDPRPVIGGNFTEYDGVPRNFIARVNVDGSPDGTFNPGTGADDVVYAVAKQGNKVIMAGAFSSVDLRRRGGVARLNENGSLDTSFETGSGANNIVYALTVSATGKPLIGGIFTSINSTRRVGIARLNLDGALDTSFMDTAYNQFAGLINPLSPENLLSQENFVKGIGTYYLTNFTFFTNQVITNIDVVTNGFTNQVTVTNDIVGTNFTTREQVFIGGKFTQVGGGFRRDDIRPRNNVARLIGGETPGPGNIQFLRDVYSADEDGGRVFVTLTRTNGTLGIASADFATADPPAGPGVARAGVDYGATNRTAVWRSSWNLAGTGLDRQFSSALQGPNFQSFSTNRQRDDLTDYIWPAKPGPRFTNPGDDDVFVTILDDALIEGDEVLNLVLTKPDGTRLLLGGEPIPLGTALGRANATLIISDNDFNYGTLGFASPTYTVNENERTASIMVTRVGGSQAPVSIDYATSDGTANAPLDYLTTRGTLSFASGQTNASFTIPIKDDTSAEFEETVKLTLLNPSGFPNNVPFSSRLDTNRATAILTIIDNDFAYGRLSFDNPTYNVGEGDGNVTVNVRRTGGNLGDLVVSYATSDGSAKSPADYQGVTNILHWVDGDTAPKSFKVAIKDNTVVESDKTFNLRLFNAIVQGVPNDEALGIQPTATVKILNDDSYGAFSFSQSIYDVDENGGRATITILRSGGVAGNGDKVAVSYATTNITAEAGKDYQTTTGTVTFVEGQTSASFDIPILDNNVVNGDLTLGLLLSKPVLGTIGAPSVSTLTIRDNELQRVPPGSVDTSFSATGTDGFVYSLELQPDGGILLGGDFSFANNITRHRMARFNSDGSLDRSFDSFGGPNAPVRAMDLEGTGRIVVGGFFTSINGTNRNYIARLNVDGAIDPTFNPGAGTDNPIYALGVQGDGRVVIGGDFSSFNGVLRGYIARLNTNGVLDFSFDPGSGANKTIYAIALQSDGKILIGGDFTEYNGQKRAGIARLNRDGSLDASFDPGTDARGAHGVRSIGLQSDGRVIVGGLFSTWAGTSAAVGNVVRLGRDGKLDTTFVTSKGGANGSVQSIAFQIDGKILLGGDFTTYNGVTRNRITRLLSNGENDPAINFGTGANSTVSAILLQPDRKIILAGGFTTYDSQPHQHIVRIHGGAASGAGAIEFSKAFYSVVEGETNTVVEVHRTGGTFGDVQVQYGFDLRNPGTAATNRFDFTPALNTLTFKEGETFQTFKVFVHDDNIPQDDETINLILTNATGGAVIGLQPTATITLINDDSEVGFSASNFSVTENFFTGSAAITVQRSGSRATPLTVQFFTRDGTATAGQDYTAITAPVIFASGEVSKVVTIPIFNDALVEGNETVQLFLTNAVPAVRISRGQATLTIVDDDFAPGSILFSQASYSFAEGVGNALITVRRTNGYTGSISASYRTVGGTAIIGSDYLETSGVVGFGDGETIKTFPIKILNDELVETNKTILVELSNPTGGATILPPTRVTVTIVDDDRAPGSVDESFDPGAGADAAIRAVQLDDIGSIVIGGDFTSFNGAVRSHVARLAPAGGVDTSFDPGEGPNNSVSALALRRGESGIFIGGSFGTVDGIIRNRVAKLMASGALDTSFNLPVGLNGQVNVIAPISGNRILIAGAFDIASVAGRSHIAVLNANGTLDTSFDPGAGPDGTVNAVAVQSDDKIIIGGAFTKVAGFPVPGIARLNSNGSVDTSFRQPALGAGGVNALLLLPDGSIMAGGDFTSGVIGGAQRLVRLKPDGSIDQVFQGLNRAVYALATQFDGKILAAGDFTQVESVERNRVARFNLNGTLDGTFDPGAGPDGRVLGITVTDEGKILIVGSFKSVNTIKRAGIARLFGDPGLSAMVTISNVRRDVAGFSFDFSSIAGVEYQIESSTDLKTWTTLKTVTAGGNVMTVTESARNQAKFYRVRRLR